MRKFVIVVICVVVAASAPGLWTPSAQALGAPVIDIAAIGQAAWQFTTDTLAKTALAALKKRIIDTMTDEIITWINGGGSPKFITNFGQQVFQPALQQAIGDTAQQILPSLCSPYAFKVNLELAAPQPLSQPSSCTLNSIVANFNDFRNNFNSGGIIGYSELLQPQNNQYGVDIITRDALYNNVQQVTAQNVLQTQVNVGFNAQQCIGWKAVDPRSGQVLFDGKTANPTGYQDPSNPPPVLDPQTGGFAAVTQTLIQSFGADPNSYRPSNFSWQCADLKVSTPGSALAEGLNKSLYANLDLTINDQDITNALAMIADAAFNRLIKAGVQGVQGIIRTATTGGGSAGGTQGTGTNGYDETNIPTSTVVAADNYANTVNAALQNQYLAQLDQASSSLSDAAATLATASSTNWTLATSTLPALIKCLGSNSSSSDLAWAQGNLTIAVSSTPLVIKQAAAQIASSGVTVGNLISTINSPNLTSSTLSGVNANEVTNLMTVAANLDGSAQTTLSGIQTALGAAQTKLTQCQASQ